MNEVYRRDHQKTPHRIRRLVAPKPSTASSKDPAYGFRNLTDHRIRILLTGTEIIRGDHGTNQVIYPPTDPKRPLHRTPHPAVSLLPLR